MKTALNYSLKPYAHADLHAGSALPGAAPSASRIRHTCTLHPEVVRDAPVGCPEYGMTLMPMPEAMVRAAMALRSLSAVSNALRFNRI